LENQNVINVGLYQKLTNLQRTGNLSSVLLYERNSSGCGGIIRQVFNVPFADVAKKISISNRPFCHDQYYKCNMTEAQPVIPVLDIPKKKGVRGCFIFLASGLPFLERLRNILPALQRYYFDWYGESDIIVFYSKVSNNDKTFENLKTSLSSLTKAHIRYVNISR
jgi:hypothetical protein